VSGFGRRVIGDQEWEAQEAAAKVAAGRGGFGPRVTGDVAEAPPVATEEPEAPEAESSEDAPSEFEAPTRLSLVELEKALAENATKDFFDEMLEVEMSRVEGPRKGGLRLLLRAEQVRDEVAPREAIVNELTAALKV
jgi:hypothetical protein